MFNTVRGKMSANKSTGRRAGTPNYKRGTLLNIIKDVLPSGACMWQEVADRYKYASGELLDRKPSDIKRQFIQKYCNLNKKVTGQSAPKDQIREAQAIYEKFL